MSEAIKVRNAYKTFSKLTVLDGLNMTVNKGTIYGLLGPSGCGKTTLLKCILSRIKLDSGIIKVDVKSKKEIGFMPQDLSLPLEMTIQEVFNYYGVLYNMSMKAIKLRIPDLLKLLNLPRENCIIRDLSGGQQRRVSFGVALLHDPDLYILDEPTVGVDLLLSQSIWEHLIKLSEYGKTIVITTHYIEEAKKAHAIGLMRNGKLLVEKSPSDILIEENCDYLEDAFLKLCEKPLDIDSAHTFRPLILNEKIENHLEQDSKWKTERYCAQLVKTLIWFRRNKVNTLFLLLLPALMAFISNWIFRSNPKDLRIAVVSDELRYGYDGCDKNIYQFDSAGTCLNFTEPLSCLYRRNLNKEIFDIIPFLQIEEAKRKLKAGKVWAVLYFSEDYTKSLSIRMKFPGRKLNNTIIDDSNIEVWMDMSNPWIAGIIKKELMFNTFYFIRKIFSNCGIIKRATSVPLKFEEPVFGDNKGIFIYHALPGLLCSFCFYLPMMYTISAILTERNSGLLERSLTAGITLYEVLSAHFSFQFIISALQTGIMLLISYAVYDCPQQGNWILICLLLFVIEAMGSTYGLLLSVMFELEKFATYTAIGTVLCIFGVLGVIWPLEGMHYILRSIIWAIPVLPASESYRGIAQRAWGITHPVIAKGIVQSTIWTIIFSVTATIILKRMKI